MPVLIWLYKYHHYFVINLCRLCYFVQQMTTLTLEASNFVLIFAILNAFCKLAGGQKMLHFLTIKNAFRRQSCTQMIGWDSGNWTRRVVFIF